MDASSRHAINGPPNGPRRAWLRRGLAVLGFALMLGVGLVYLAAGLVVPIPALFGVWALWLAFAVTQVLMRRRLWAILAIPAIALLSLIAIASIGDAYWGWTA